MRVKRGKPSFSPAGCAELAVVRFVESMCVPSPEARFADFSSGEARHSADFVTEDTALINIVVAFAVAKSKGKQLRFEEALFL